MQTPSTDGLLTSSAEERRWTIVPIYNASEHEAVGLERLWSARSASQALEVLSKPDVTVTNQSDKDVQLPKLLKLNDFAKSLMAA